LKSPRRALSRGGLRKNPDSDLHSPKAKKRDGFWFPLFQCVSAKTLKHGSDHSTIGETRISGFGLKCTGILQRDISGNCPFFTSVSGDTSKKKNRGVFWSRTFPCVSGQTRKPRGGAIVNYSNPCLRVWPETHSMPLIEISLEFFLTKLQNALLIAILIFTGRSIAR
jgi:hypothetical protein